jgi:hypothetical protein
MMSSRSLSRVCSLVGPTHPPLPIDDTAILLEIERQAPQNSRTMLTATLSIEHPSSGGKLLLPTNDPADPSSDLLCSFPGLEHMLL